MSKFIEVKVQEGIERNLYNVALNVSMISHIEDHVDRTKGTNSIVHMLNGDWYFCDMKYRDFIRTLEHMKM